MDWVALLEDNHIPYVTSGPNTKRGEVSIKCPWCGPDDPSEHLGIKLEGEVWGCHRNQAHRGKSPTKLIVALLGCAVSEAYLILELYDRPDPDALISLEAEKEPPVKPIEAIKLPPEARPIPSQGRFFDYIRSRGFDNPDAVSLYYNLHCCTTGRWKDRIIIPVYNENLDLIAWTARAINRPVSAPRYLTTEGNVIKTTLYNLHNLVGGQILFITEGPLDAIKVDWNVVAEDCGATAVFGTSITPDQISLLSEASKRYKKTVILLDADAIESAFNLQEWLTNSVIGQLPDGIKDPGDLSKSQVKALVNTYKN